jgi:uncharacterized protein (DUF1800 family)
MTTPKSSFWSPYEPDAKAPWDLRRVVHLHRRAGFAGTWAELQRDLKDGPGKAVARFLAGNAALAVPPDFAAVADVLDQAAGNGADIRPLQAAWFHRILFGPDPLTEKLTLLWHDHFATAYDKVGEVGLMWRQNATFRKHARGKFADLLNASAREPALLLYLDAQANRKDRPNENLARELMELFTLGVGNYTEADVKEAARCLTGWTIDEGDPDRGFVEDARIHDDGAKTVLGRSGKWTGADLVRILLDHPATAGRVAAKLGRLFFGEGALPVEAVRELASDLRAHDLGIGRAVGVVLRSRLFFADANLRTRVLGPVEYVAGAVRGLGLLDPPPSTVALAEWAGRIGQELFNPPNVGGWPTGRGWVHARGLIARANFAAALLAGPGVGRRQPYDPAAETGRHGFGTRPEDVLTFHHRLLFGNDPPAEVRRRLPGDAGQMVAALLASPEAQLG